MSNILNTGSVTSRSYGLSTFRATDLTNSAQTVKASEGNVWGINAINDTGAVVYIKFYNADAEVGTTTPIYTLQVEANSYRTIPVGNIPQFECDTRIEVAAVTGLGDDDSTAPASTAVIEIIYT